MINRFVQIDLKTEYKTFQNIRAIEDYMKEAKPDCYHSSRQWLKVLCNGKYSKPIIEHNVTLNHDKDYILSQVKDHVFFKIEDRKAAFDLVSEETQMFLKGIGYLKMNDFKLIEFLSKRVIEKAKLTSRWKSFNPHLYA